MRRGKTACNSKTFKEEVNVTQASDFQDSPGAVPVPQQPVQPQAPSGSAHSTGSGQAGSPQAAPAAPAPFVEHRRGGQKGKKPRRRQERDKSQSEFVEKVVSINRVSKVVKGGKNFSFTALVIVGDGKGRIGFSVGKAREVQDAIRKGLTHAKAQMFRVPIKGVTIPHEIIGRFGAARVLFKPAHEGTGVISGAAVRAVCECAGIKDILTKSLGSETPINVVRATVAAFQQMRLGDDLV